MKEVSTLKLFATHEHPCSYLPNQVATTVFVDPDATLNADMYSELSDMGFRRSGSHVYRPHCASCQACIPVRVPVNRFSPNRSQKRCLKRNDDLAISMVGSIDTDEHYQLYQSYINERHQDGDMYPPSKQQYDGFLNAQWGVTRYIEFRSREGALLALAVSDRLSTGLSAIYTFFAPGQTQRSLGTYAVLTQIALAKDWGLPYLYLGYWIAACDKMAYKNQYRPLERLEDHQWTELAV